MSRVCSVCGKGKLSGNLVSHSNRKTPKLYEANLQKVSVKKENGTVSLRARGGIDCGVMPVDEMVAKLKEEIDTKKR